VDETRSNIISLPRFVDENELEFFKEKSVQFIDELVIDLEKGIFNNYNAYMTSFGVELATIDDVVKFLPTHEGLHLGYSMALKRIVNK